MTRLGLPAMYGDGRRWGVIHADALTLLRQLPGTSVDAVVTDPPYFLGIGGEAWDGAEIVRRHGQNADRSSSAAFQQFSERWAAECRRVLKPGGHLLAFGAPRTIHRVTAGLEDAGLEIRDQLLWLFSSGVPKSRRLGGGRAAALKPAYEPIVLARAPLDGTLDWNLKRWDTGALNVDAARIPAADRSGDGRWPANIALTHIAACRPSRCRSECPIKLLDGADAGSRSRFFYHAKASRSEREAGCQELPSHTSAGVFASGTRDRRNDHPTVKPLALMRWLIRLACPEGGIVLDPFCGSGSTGAAAMLEGRGFIGIDSDDHYIDIAKARINHWAVIAKSRHRPSACLVTPTPHLRQQMVRSNQHQLIRGHRTLPISKTKGQVYHEEVEALKATGVSNAEAVRQVARKRKMKENAIRSSIHQYRSRHLDEAAPTPGASVDELLKQAEAALTEALALVDREVEDAKAELDAAQARYDEAVKSVGPRKAEIEKKLKALG